jgi:EPS-associated MarR family transcriptional regulator
MNKYQNDENNLGLLRKIQKSPNNTQRKLAKDLGLSLGKINYCLKELNKKGFVKIKNFKNNKNKFNYIYVLTPKGINYRVNLTIKFMKRKMKEYDELKKEI